MHIVGELKMNFREYRRLVLPAFGRWYPIIQAGLAVFAVLTVVQLAVAGYSPILIGELTGFIVGVILPDMTALIGWRGMAKMGDEPWRYVVTDSTAEVHTPHTDSTVRWDGISGARTGRHVWVLSLVNKGVVAIPRAAFTADDAVQIDAFVDAVGAKTR